MWIVSSRYEQIRGYTPLHNMNFLLRFDLTSFPGRDSLTVRTLKSMVIRKELQVFIPFLLFFREWRFLFNPVGVSGKGPSYATYCGIFSSKRQQCIHYY